MFIVYLSKWDTFKIRISFRDEGRFCLPKMFDIYMVLEYLI